MPNPTDREVILESRLAEANARIAELTRHDPVYRAAVRHFTLPVLLDDARKELLSLRVACRLWGNEVIPAREFAEAIADVEIVLAELRVIVGDSAVDAAKAQKLDRLVRRMGGGE